MKVVIDTNVFISAFVFGGNAERVLEKALALGEIVTSSFILSELSKVLTEKFEVPSDKLYRILNTLNQFTSTFEPDTRLPEICRDPDDNNILQLAEFAKADFIVSGDKDLLSIKIFGNTQILSPASFLEIV